MMNDENLILEIRNLEKTYVTEGEKLSVLKGLDLFMKEGQRVSIIGESGNGKSTLLNIAGGIDTATAGFVRAGKYILTDLSEDELTEFRSEFTGLIFQFHYLLKDFTALENIFLPAFMAGVSKKEAMERAEKLIDDVGLSSRKNHLPSQLSGGERQRIAVARSLVNEPRLILADEPTGNLDPANAEMIGDLLFSMAGSYGKSLLLVTHDMNLASKAEVCYRMKDGKLVLQDGLGNES